MTARLDANVLIRYLTKEPIEQAERSAALMAAIASGREEVFLEEGTIAEVVWTLSSFYRVGRTEIAESLLGLLVRKEP